MLGLFTVGKKAAKYGYRKFGVPGAVVGGVGAAVGYRALKRRTESAVEEEETDDDPATGDGDGSKASDD